jgi:hypothetical protein
VQFGYNMHEWVFQRPQNSTSPKDECYLFIMLCQFHTIISAQIQTQEYTNYQSINQWQGICYLWKTHECMFIQISRETMLLYLLIIYIKMFETIVVLTYVYIYSEHFTGKFSWLCYITLYNASSLKIPLNSVSFVSLV